MFLFCEPFDPNKLSKLTERKKFILNLNIEVLDILTNLKAIAVNRSDGFIPGNSNSKRKRNPGKSAIPLKH